MSLDFTDLAGWTPPVVPWHRSGEPRTLIAWGVAWLDAARPVPNGQERCFLGPEGVGSLHEACAFPTRALAEAAMIARWPRDPQVHLAVVAIAKQGPRVYACWARPGCVARPGERL